MNFTRSIVSNLFLFGVLSSAASGQGLLRDLEPGIGSSFSSGFTAIPGGVLFIAHTRAQGREIWRTDGTTAGTICLDVNPGPADGIRGEFGALGDGVLFVSSTVTQDELFFTDGTPAGTRTLGVLTIAGRRASVITPVAVVGRFAYLLASDGFGTTVLIRTDGTLAGRAEVRRFMRAVALGMIAVGGRLCFALSGQGGSLWFSDGTAAGTTQVGTWLTTSPRQLTAVGNRVFFIEEVVRGGRAWVSDGTFAGTLPVGGMSLRTSRAVASFGPSGSAAIFTARSASGWELWRVDPGATAGVLLATLLPTSGSNTSVVAFAGRNRIHAFANSSGTKTLWSSDGTVAGTGAVSTGDYSWIGATVLGDSLLFANTDAAGTEPWVSDGSAAGTRRFVDLVAGPSSSGPESYAAIVDFPSGPRLFFNAQDPQNGYEPRVLPLGRTGVGALVPISGRCGNPAGAPALTRASGYPVVGNAGFGFELATTRANALAALLVDADLGATIGSCATMLPAVITLVLRTDARGRVRQAAPVPLDPSLVGQRLYIQGVVHNPGGAIFGSFDATGIHALLVGG